MSDHDQASPAPEQESVSDDVAAMLRLLGLARRAGKLEVGFNAVLRLAQHHKDVVVMVTRDMGPSQRHKVGSWDVARTVTLPLSSTDLGEAMGRDKVAVLGLRDPGFVQGIAKLGL